MKVVCIGNKEERVYFGDKSVAHYNLTIGKIYDADVSLSNDRYIILINDTFFTSTYPTYLFKSLDDIRDEKIKELLYE